MDKNLNEDDLFMIKNQISEGYTSGILNDGEGKHIAWELRYDVWSDEEDDTLNEE